jgi:GNAT superfamily N-acetyltransferase
MTLRLSTYVGGDMVPLLPDLARLCTIVFREWPHLYEGDGSYDQEHLSALAASPRVALVVAYDGEQPIGMSTCLPLEDATPGVQAPFLARGWPLDRFFYFAESVLLPDWRGQGIGAAFFATREAHARAVSDCAVTCFCTIQRPPTDPARPTQVRALDGFWRGLGYAPIPGLQCVMTWREIGRTEDSDVTLLFWAKSLRPSPDGRQPWEMIGRGD